MSDLSAKFASLQAQLSEQAAATDILIDTVEPKLQDIFDTLDTVLVNNAANTRAILTALGSLDPCACSGAPTLVVPPIGTIPITISEEQCQKIQAFLHTMQEIFTVLDAASAFSVGLNFSLVSNSINEVIGSIESGSELPVISYAEASLLINDIISYIIGNLTVGGTLSGYFASIILDLRSGMALATSASDAQSLYDGIVDTSDLPDYVKPVIKHAAYRSLYSYYFDPGTEPNLAGFDGSLCGGSLVDSPVCVDIPASEAFFDGATWYVIIAPPSATIGTEEFVTLGNFNGWVLTCIAKEGPSSIRVRVIDAFDVAHESEGLNEVGQSRTLAEAEHGVTVYYSQFDANRFPFTVRFCPPEV